VQHWHVAPEHLEHADPGELRRNRYLDRREAWRYDGESVVVAIDPTLGTVRPVSRRKIAAFLSSALLDAYAVTLGHDRDLEFLAEFLRRQGYPCPALGHVDATAVAAGAMFGYAQGWAKCHDALPEVDGVGARIDLAPLELPFGSRRIAAAMGLHVPEHAEDALARAQLAGALWAAATATPGPAPERPAPTPPAAEEHPNPCRMPDPADVLVAASRPAEEDDPRTGRPPYRPAAGDTLVMPTADT
jgi:hypothetical protein